MPGGIAGRYPPFGDAASSKSRRLQAITASCDLVALEPWQKERMEPFWNLNGNTYVSTQG